LRTSKSADRAQFNVNDRQTRFADDFNVLRKETPVFFAKKRAAALYLTASDAQSFECARAL